MERLTTVFGGTGFLGRAIVRHLVTSGQPVRIAARHPRRLAFADTDAEPERQSTDIRDERAVAAAIAGAGSVVNAVGLYVEQPGATFEAVHVDGAAHVARYARESGARLVHVSGIGADSASASRYVAARGRGEAAVQAEYPEAIIVRPSVLFGPGDAFVGTLELATRLPAVPLFGWGRTRLQPVYVDDVARAVARLLTLPFPAGQVFELGGGRIYTYREILELVLDYLGRRRLLVPMPFAAWRVLAGVASLLPHAPLTADQVLLMEDDNVASGDVPGFETLGIEPRSLADALAESLRRRC